MSYDAMAAHDAGIEEAKTIVRRFMELEACGENDCKICPVIKKKRRRILAALERAKENR